MPFYPPHYKVFYSAAKKKNKDNKLFDSKNRNYMIYIISPQSIL